MKHELKILRKYYKLITERIKTFEIRKDDRNFKKGDWLLLREVIEDKFLLKYTGEEMMIRILNIDKNCEFLKENYVIIYLDIDNMFYYNVN